MGSDFQLIYFYEDDITDINKNNAFTLSPSSVKVQKKIWKFLYIFTAAHFTLTKGY